MRTTHLAAKRVARRRRLRSTIVSSGDMFGGDDYSCNPCTFKTKSCDSSCSALSQKPEEQRNRMMTTIKDSSLQKHTVRITKVLSFGTI
jgi:hypothetical protein